MAHGTMAPWHHMPGVFEAYLLYLLGLFILHSPAAMTSFDVLDAEMERLKSMSGGGSSLEPILFPSSIKQFKKRFHTLLCHCRKHRP